MNMTLFNILVPLAALGVAGIGALAFYLTDPDRVTRRKR